MTEQQKIHNIEEQITAIERGTLKNIKCPYCDCFNTPGEDMCCKLFVLAFIAITDRKRGQEMIDHVEQVMEKVSRN